MEKEKKIIFSVRVGEDMLEKLRQVALKQDRPIGYLVRKAISDYLQKVFENEKQSL
ncbi:MAG: ribbon-helix-helix protein, CopG family [Nitrososphaerota archaeon]